MSLHRVERIITAPKGRKPKEDISMLFLIKQNNWEFPLKPMTEQQVELKLAELSRSFTNLRKEPYRG